MAKLKSFICVLFVFVGFTVPNCFAQSNPAEKLEKLSLMATSPVDGIAVVKNAEGELETWALWDAIDSLNIKIVQIKQDLLILESQNPDRNNFWMYLAEEGKTSRINEFVKVPSVDDFMQEVNEKIPLKPPENSK